MPKLSEQAATTHSPIASSETLDRINWYWIPGNSQDPDDTSYQPRNPESPGVDGVTENIFAFYNTAEKLISYKNKVTGTITVSYKIARGGGGSTPTSRINLPNNASGGGGPFNQGSHELEATCPIGIYSSTGGFEKTESWTAVATLLKADINKPVDGWTIVNRKFTGTDLYIAVRQEPIVGKNYGAWFLADLTITVKPFDVLTSAIDSDTVRRELREIDKISGHYPTISRTGDSSRKGNFGVSFDDRNTIVFNRSLSNISYPQLTPTASKHPLLSLGGYATPHTNQGELVTQGDTLAGITDNSKNRGDRFLIGDRHDNDVIANGEASKGSVNINPFDESRISLTTSTFYMTGTSEMVYPGFDSRLHDKTQITIDLTPKTDTFLYRLGQQEAGLDASGEFYNNPSTGFLYYDHKNKNWQNTGNYNDNSGIQGPAIQNFRAGTGKLHYALFTGSDRIACQFIASPHDGATGGKLLRENYLTNGANTSKISYNQLGYTNIGKPTNFFLAPSSTRYFATSSQTLDMSNYISQPFLLEKAVLEVPFVYRRKVSGSYGRGSTSSTANKLKNITGSNTRDIDNFVFFAYRQTDSKIVGDDSEVLHSKISKRELIFSSSLSFFNSESMYFLENNSDKIPLHSPSTAIDVNLSVVDAGSTNTQFEKVITGTYRLEIIPAVQQRGLLGMTNYLGVSNTTSSAFLPDMGSAVNTIDPFFVVSPVQHFYEGGVRNSRFFPADHTGSLVGGNDNNPADGTKLFLGPASGEDYGYLASTTPFRKASTPLIYQEYVSEVSLNKSSLNPSPRSFVSQFGKDSDPTKTAGFLLGDVVGGIGPYKVYYNNVNLPAVEAADSDIAPYLLFPNDKLVFGWDVGISYDTDMLNVNKISESSLSGFPQTNFDGGTLADQDPVVRQSLCPRSSFCQITGSFGKILSSKPTKLTLYGSQVRQKKEFHDTLNQNLTTLAVHEAIHYDNPVIDQFLVATEVEYSGSYMDTYITGSVGSIAKSIIGSGENIISSSLQRFNAFSNKQQRFYDTVLPSVEEMFKVDGHQPADAGIFSPKLKGLVLGGIGSGSVSAGSPLFRHSFWSYIFPFESRYNKVKKQIKQNTVPFYINATKPSGGSLVSLGPTFLGKPDTLDMTREQRFNQGNGFFFGFGPDAISDSSSSFRPNEMRGFGGDRFDRPVGCKYGILNFDPQFTKNIFRGDKFGQRADMLEQSQDSRFLVGSSFTSQGPIRIRFVVDDDDDDQYIVLDEDEITANIGESSNLSIYATSSLPFFDDNVVRNRKYSNALLANRVVDIIGFDS